MNLLLDHKTHYLIGAILITAGVVQMIFPAVHIQIDGYASTPTEFILAGSGFLSGHTMAKLGIKWNAPGAGNQG